MFDFYFIFFYTLFLLLLTFRLQISLYLELSLTFNFLFLKIDLTLHHVNIQTHLINNWVIDFCYLGIQNLLFQLILLKLLVIQIRLLKTLKEQRLPKFLHAFLITERFRHNFSEYLPWNLHSEITFEMSSKQLKMFVIINFFLQFVQLLSYSCCVFIFFFLNFIFIQLGLRANFLVLFF